MTMNTMQFDDKAYFLDSTKLIKMLTIVKVIIIAESALLSKLYKHVTELL